MHADEYRLPRTVAPEHYELTLTPDLAGGTFAGEERAHVSVLEPVTEIVVNAAELTIPYAELVSDGGERLTASVRLDEAAERAVVTLDGVAAPGAWVLHLTFTGVLNDKLRGFYRSTFVDGSGRPHVIATTQMEATDARRAFPCWDEPDRKATFAVTLIVDEGLTAVSNSPVLTEIDLGNGKRQVEFAPTMKMSTYLVAFVVGPLVATPVVDVDGVPLRVVCVPGKEHLGTFALEIGAHALRFFTRYFGIPYPAEKLDFIALPDFAMGAMENLGAVTFRESLLLIDPASATRVELERAADVVAHEVAHMWFGDLVTMKWWNGIWLNEAFATFMELLCIDDFRPQWDRWVSFGLSRGAAMATDGLASTRPIEYPVRVPEDAEAMFDVLTYQKGAGVLRMLERYLGAEPFRRGIAAYIAEHSYGNTETTDLWDAIEANSGEPARSTMDSWIYQGGHPVVTVEAAPDGTTLTLTQRRFRYLEPGDAADGRALWKIPILLRFATGGAVGERRILLEDVRAHVDLGAKADWVVVNAGGWGVYRVLYSSTLLAALTADLGRLDALERFNLVSDTWAAVLAGLTPLTDFVELARLLGAETDYNVWAAVLGSLDLVERAAGEAAPQVQAFVRALARPALERVGWQVGAGEEETAGTLRATLVRALGVLGRDEQVRERAAALHRQLLDDPAAVHPDVAGAVVAVVAASGGAADHDTFLQRWRTATTPQEELRYLYNLAGFEQPDLLRRTLDLALGEVRSQSAPFVISFALQNRAGGRDAWEFVKGHWDQLLERLPSNLFDRMLDGVTSFTDAALAADVRSFLANHPPPARGKIVEQILERLDVHVAFAQRERASIASAFAI